MKKPMQEDLINLQKKKQNVSADQLLQALVEAQQIELIDCTITGVLDVNRLLKVKENLHTGRLRMRQQQNRKIITFSQKVVFDRCVFEENVVFGPDWSEPESLAVEFEKDVIFNSSVFKAQSRFRNAVFEGAAGFDGCTFDGVATFKNALFSCDAKFRTAVFNGYCLLTGAVFKSSARFNNTHFLRGANLTGVQFLGQTDFSGVYSSSRSIPSHDQIRFGRKKYGGDEGFWRFVKQCAQNAGYYQMSGESFHKERSAHLRSKCLGPDFDTASSASKLLRLLGSVRLLPELIFGKFLFGYGERPVRVLVASVLIIVLCACFFSKPAALCHFREPIDPTFAQALYFSTITFTTLGYGDYYPADNDTYRALAMAEAVAGGCLMALFVVCLAKRFSRS